jgi:DNA-binding NarL/FixJ family response regulator
MKQKIRILIVDDHAMMRFALTQAIKRKADLSLVGAATQGTQALELYRKHKPDVVTMDYKLPGMDGVECTALLCNEFPEAKVLLLSIFEGSEDIWRAMQAGASGYVSKAAKISEVIQAIRNLADGKTYFSAGLAERVATRKATTSLRAQELTVLRELAAGRSAKEIALTLNLAESTIRFYLKNLYAKLGVSDRAQAITTAIQRGIIHLDS